MCGIAGIINKTPRAFDYGTFCTLGIANDTRGGDSCGVFIDGRYEYGTGENKLFANYFQESKLLDETKRSTIALVHCRKASVGAISAETAQPVVIKEGDKIVFVVMHNGTIHNYEALAKKYIPEIDIKGMTDSQVMARIFYYKGYDVLSEYNGGAVFAIVDYREKAPKVLLFKGASKRTSYSKEQEEERPLYYCIDKSKRELVFSSIWTYLMALRKECTVYTMRTNELVEFTGTALAIVSKIDRSKMQQNKEIVSTIPIYGRDSISKATDYCKRKFYGYDWDEMDDLYDDFEYGQVYDSYISVDLIRNLYSYKGKKVHGKLSLNDYGRVGGRLMKGCDVWFFNGVALKNKTCFKFLTVLEKESKLSRTDFSDKFENVIRFLSVDGVYPRGEFWYQAISPTGHILFTGTCQPLTTTSATRYSGGVRAGITFKGVMVPVKDKLSDKLDINFKEIKEECKSLMK